MPEDSDQPEGSPRNGPDAGEVVIRDDPDEGAYVIEVGGKRAGKAEYRMRDDRIIFTHTEVDDRVSGQGLGSRLARYVLDDARARSLSIVPMCPFISAYVKRHREYQELVDSEMLGRVFGSRSGD